MKLSNIARDIALVGGVAIAASGIAMLSLPAALIFVGVFVIFSTLVAS